MIRKKAKTNICLYNDITNFNVKSYLISVLRDFVCIFNIDISHQFINYDIC